MKNYYIQTQSAAPTEFVSSKIGPGEANIPLPMVIPMIIETPSNHPKVFSSSTRLSVEESGILRIDSSNSNNGSVSSDVVVIHGKWPREEYDSGKID